MFGPEEVLRSFGTFKGKPECGIIPRAVDHLFRGLEDLQQKGDISAYAVQCTYVQIYCDRVNDLISGETDLKVMGGAPQGLMHRAIVSSEDAMKHMSKAEKHKVRRGRSS